MGLFLCGPEITVAGISDPIIKILDPVWAAFSFTISPGTALVKVQKLRDYTYKVAFSTLVGKYMTELHKQYGTQQLGL